MSKVLVVDDEVDDRVYLCDTLVGAGFEVTAAVDGVRAMQAVMNRPPNLVLCDLSMPRMDGIQLIQKIRRQPLGSHLPIIVVSGIRDTPHRVAGIDCGADDYLVKPVEGTELIARVRSQLRRRDEISESRQQDHVDDLTRLLSRAGFVVALDRELSRSRRYNEPLSLLTVRVGRLHEINAEQGYLTGNAVLRAVGQALRELVRGFDIPARLGGNEFMVALPMTDVTEAEIVAKRLRTMVPRLVMVACQLPELVFDVRVAAPPDGHDTARRLVGGGATRSATSMTLVRDPATTRAFRGSLEDLSLFALLGLLDNERKSGVLRVGQHGKTGSIFLRRGQVVAARLGGDTPLRNLEALRCMLTWADGAFVFSSRRVAGPDEIGVPTTSLLMECARFIDESARAVAEA